MCKATIGADVLAAAFLLRTAASSAEPLQRHPVPSVAPRRLIELIEQFYNNHLLD
jgi:hypothetical protein